MNGSNSPNLAKVLFYCKISLILSFFFNKRIWLENYKNDNLHRKILWNISNIFNSSNRINYFHFT